MSPVESILDEIRENVRDTDDYLDVQALIQRGSGKKAIGFAYEADGPNRAKHIAARIEKELGARLHGILRADRILVQMSTSTHKPVLLKEYMAINKVIGDYCPLPGKWLNLSEHKDESLGITLRIALVIWVEPQALAN